MKKAIKRVLALFFATVIFTSIVPMHVFAQNDAPLTDADFVEELPLNEQWLEQINITTEPQQLEVGQTLQLKYTTVPENYEGEFTFTSSDENVLHVDENGMISALAQGEAEITVACESVEKSVLLSVAAPVVTATKIELWKKDFALGVGEKIQASVKFTPADTTDQSVTYTSSNTKILSVNSAGLLTGKAVGKVTLTARSGSLISKTTVEVKKAPKKLELNYSSVKFGVGESGLDLDSYCKGGYALMRTWSSSNTEVVSVDKSGILTAEGTGTANIVCKLYNGVKTTCKVTVYAAPKSAKFDESKLTLQTGVHSKSTDFTLNKGAYARSYKITSSDPSVVYIIKKDTLKAKKPGTAVITLTLYNGVTAKKTVQVKNNERLPANQEAMDFSTKCNHVQRYIYGKSYQGRLLEAYIINPYNDKTLFIDFAIHGFEDDYYRDGQELTQEANNLVYYYAKWPEELKDYRLVIVPCVNPDGTFAGKNNYRSGYNAFGRCTANHVDMNRDFRRQNAVETRALIRFMDKCDPDIYLNAHGWLDETIGTASLSKIVKSELGLHGFINAYVYAEGYAIGYVHNRYGIPCCLIEYAAPNKISHKRTVNMINRIVDTY